MPQDKQAKSSGSGKGAMVVLLVLAVVLAAGVVQLLRLRFDAGDVYQPYSSLRSDPLGTKVLYESLDALPEVTCHRGLMNLDRLRLEQAGSLLVLGVDPRSLEYKGWMDDAEFKALQGLVVAGARVVFTVTPVRRSTMVDREGNEEEDKNEESEEENEEEESEEEEDTRMSLSERWAIGLDIEKFYQTGRTPPGLKAVKGKELDGVSLPEWRSNSVFTEVEDSGWEVLATLRGEPVIVDRKFGKGSVVMIADSYFVSNEAMRQHRDTEFLAWMVGNGGDVYFDETHHGVRSNPGIMNLARRYRLHGLFIGAAMFLGLLIWRNSMSLVPPDLDRDFGLSKDGAVSGEGAASGFARLLHRGISKGEVLRHCVAVWESRRPTRQKPTEAQRAEIDQILGGESAGHDPAAGYQKITRTLHPELKRKEPSSS